MSIWGKSWSCNNHNFNFENLGEPLKCTHKICCLCCRIGSNRCGIFQSCNINKINYGPHIQNRERRNAHAKLQAPLKEVQVNGSTHTHIRMLILNNDAWISIGSIVSVRGCSCRNVDLFLRCWNIGLLIKLWFSKGTCSHAANEIKIRWTMQHDWLVKILCGMTCINSLVRQWVTIVGHGTNTPRDIDRERET